MRNPEPKPPNLIFSDESYFYKTSTWWDVGESGMLLVFYFRDNHSSEVEFNIYELLASPYSNFEKPYAELYKKGNTAERTLDINDAEVDMHGWVNFEGQISIDLPSLHKSFVDKGKVETNWKDIDSFTSDFRTIVKRVIYEAVEIVPQIAEETEINFDKENPYLNSKKEKIIKSSSQATKNTDKDKSSPLGCLILIILILIVWLIFK